MRRWMSIITLAAFMFALVAGWGIGQLAGGGDGDDLVVLRPLATLTPTTTPVSREPTAPSISTPAATVAAAPQAAEATSAISGPASPTQPLTEAPDVP